MKDARGHGSNPRGGRAKASGVGAHQAGVTRVGLINGKRQVYAINGKPSPIVPRGFAVQRLNTKAIGPPWKTVASGRRRAVAESIAKGQRVDNPNSLVRVRPSRRSK